MQNFYSSHASFDFGKLPYRKNEIMNSSADTSGIEDLGYLPKANLDEVFREYLVDMKKRCQNCNTGRRYWYGHGALFRKPLPRSFRKT